MNDLSKEQLDLLLDEASKPAFDKMTRLVGLFSGAATHKKFLDEQYYIMMDEIEIRLLDMFRAFDLSKEKLALLLLDEKPIYRRIAKARLDEISNDL